MSNRNQKNQQGQKVKPAQDANTPQNVIANAARFDNMQVGGNPITVSMQIVNRNGRARQYHQDIIQDFRTKL